MRSNKGSMLLLFNPFSCISYGEWKISKFILIQTVNEHGCSLDNGKLAHCVKRFSFICTVSLLDNKDTLHMY